MSGQGCQCFYPRFTGPILSLVVAAGLMAGCEEQTQMTQSRSLPEPVVVDSRTIDRPAPAPVKPGPVAPAPAPAPSIGKHAEWMPNFKSRRWQGIVIHHSAIPAYGNAASLDQAHKGRGFDGLGYHFVIGNGTKSKDGEVEVGFRWPIQREGAHVKRPGAENWWNEHTIGIVLVGNFDTHPPSEAQMRSLVELTVWLCREFNIPYERIYFHREVKQTECPGNDFPRAAVRARIRAALGK
jgi:hypothetical protein